MHWYLREPDRQLDVESSEMREAIALRYYLSHGGERMAAEELGRRIDDCLVDYICISLHFLTTGEISIEEFKSRMPMIEAGMEEDPELQAFAVTLQETRGAPSRQQDLSRSSQTAGPVRRKTTSLLRRRSPICSCSTG